MESELLKDLVVIFTVAVATVVVLRRVGVPSIAGFIIAGVVAGPNVLAIVDDVHDVEVLADVGVALLLFGIGLELSLDRVRRLWRSILAGGALQVFATAAAVVAALRFLGFGFPIAIFFGCVIAVSSTAVVLSAMRTRGDIDAPHGRLTLGILIFQDLSVVPMILVVPLLAGSAPPGALAMAVAKSAAVLIAVLFLARFLAPRLLNFVARTRQRDVFVLSVFLICIGTAWLVSAAGVSLALGAFLAGLVVADSEYRHQALSDLIPFREVFASLFFVSVGMLLDPRAITQNALPIFALLAAIVFGKAVIATLASLVLRLPLRVSVLAGLALAQVGEFSFVLLAAGRDSITLPEPFTGNLAVAIVVSMLITPLIIAISPRVTAGMGRVPVLTRRLEVRTPADRPQDAGPMKDHVIIAGYGLTGQELAHSLEDCGVPYVVVDINPENVRGAIKRAEPAYFGDVTSSEVLESLGTAYARELVLVINDVEAAVRTIHAARRIAPSLPVFVRVFYAADIPRVTAAGATEVVAAELEASVEMTERILERCAVRTAAVAPQLERIRERREDEFGDSMTPQ
ncbi:MAG: cation:proton antiporter [Candidatus Krumholzibacteria bacterium]|nr:cation:proton antiporter [Candidatus Krumholzibacteria bacterium]